MKKYALVTVAVLAASFALAEEYAFKVDPDTRFLYSTRVLKNPRNTLHGETEEGRKWMYCYPTTNQYNAGWASLTDEEQGALITNTLERASEYESWNDHEKRTIMDFVIDQINILREQHNNLDPLDTDDVNTIMKDKSKKPKKEKM